MIPRFTASVRTTLALLGLLASHVGAAEAQAPLGTRPMEIRSAGPTAADTLLQSGPPSATVGIGGGDGPLLDRPINRSEYVLGPSDDLVLSIFGFRSDQFQLSVSPEGTVVIPGVGVLAVGGLTIEEAERAVTQPVRRIYRDVDVSLTLAAVRSFKIFVVGEVPQAGVREATAVTRVSEVIPNTNGEGVAYRNVTIRRSTGELLDVDLARFLRLGDLAQNPRLEQGDVINVPAIDQTVLVSGSVATPGTYAFRNGESLSEVLLLANGGPQFPSEAADSIRLMRFTNENPRGTILSIARAEATGGEQSDLALQPFDAIYVPRVVNFRRRTTASIEGEVQRPGRYPIRPGETTVRELIEIAGGFTEDASLLDAALRRAEDPARAADSTSLANVPPELLSIDEQRILQVTRSADDRNVVIDFRQLFTEGGNAYDLTIRDGDELYVPQHRNEIAVLGAVGQPGILQFVPDQPIDYFVALAGGYTSRADRNDLVVLKGKLGNRVEGEDIEVLEPGDRIIVPFRESRTFLDRVQTAQGVVSTISGFVLTIVGLERLWDTVVN